jgi:hypothetical protein
MTNIVLSHTSKWVTANNLALNLYKTNIIKFITNNSPQYALSIGYEKYKDESVNTKFLGLQIDSHLNWKNHIVQMVPKLSRARYECHADQCFISATLTLSNQCILLVFIQ